MPLTPNSKAVKAYYKTLERYAKVGADHEQAVKTAFHSVLQEAAGSLWTLVPEHTPRGKRIRYDGIIRDEYGLTLGYWEAKDSQDNLDKEVQKKVDKGYSLQNTLFQAPDRALLYQDEKLLLDADLTKPEKLVEAINLFLDYRAPDIERFHDAVSEFKERIPELAEGLLSKIDEARKEDADFRKAFDGFVETVRESVNPNIDLEAVEEMLVQHLLTERVIRTVFNNRDFARRNAIAVEIEKVIDALTARHMSRGDFLGRLDRFYKAIEDAADGITEWSDKQDFLNTIYEQFFQGFSDRIADTHGIVYTPQPLVDFMVRSVDKLLQRHFGQSLADTGVHVLDPFVGTGNFLIRVMDEIPAPKLPAKYADELHANEVMLLPYYVASLNIEHAYLEKTGSYQPFPGIVLVDTFEMVEGKQIGFISAENSQRAQRQRQSPIKVIMGNPPYNANQVNANDNNRNRKYPIIDGRIRETYADAGTATLKNKLYDQYVRAFRWASDRVGQTGIVAFVTNNSFLRKNVFDGMRQHLGQDFSAIYMLNPKGDARTAGEPRRRQGGNVFTNDIRVGVSITFLVRNQDEQKGDATIYHCEVDDYVKASEKQDLLIRAEDIDGIDWRELHPDVHYTWLTDDLAVDWDDFIPLASKTEKASSSENETTILDEYSLGVSTNRDVWVYGFDRERLLERVERFVDTYNGQVVRWQRKGNGRLKPQDVVTSDETRTKWSSTLLRRLKSGHMADVDGSTLRRVMYRPFVQKWLHYDDVLVDRGGLWREYFPSEDSENRVICVSNTGWRTEFATLMLNQIGDLHLLAAADGFQNIPFYIYREDGTREENLTDWSLEQFKQHYANQPRRYVQYDVTVSNNRLTVDQEAGEFGPITKWDVFHYVYAVLHHPAYRERYAGDLKRSLPCIPFAPEFWPFAEAGKELAELHVGYETTEKYDLEVVHNPGAPLDYRIEKMKLDKEAGELILNDHFTLGGIPAEAHRYRLGNRSALEWLVDQIRVKTDKRSGITHDPNAAFKNDELVDHIKRVTHVSVETVRIVEGLPDLGLPKD